MILILSIDSFVYFGTDDLYLNSLAQFVKPNGLIAIAGAGLKDENRSDGPGSFAAVVGAGDVLPAFGAVLATPLVERDSHGAVGR